MTPNERLLAVLSPELVGALAELVSEEVERQLAGRGSPRNSPAWLTLDQAAERLDCTPDAVRMRMNRGRLERRPRDQGRRVYVSAASVDRLT